MNNGIENKIIQFDKKSIDRVTTCNSIEGEFLVSDKIKNIILKHSKINSLDMYYKSLGIIEKIGIKNEIIEDNKYIFLECLIMHTIDKSVEYIFNKNSEDEQDDLK